MIASLHRPRILAFVALLAASLVVVAACASYDAVNFVNGNTGWAAGNSGIMKTTDGGETWTKQYDGPAHVISLDFVDEQHGWAVGDSTLLATTDGGQTWVTAGEPSQPLLKVAFVDASTGYGIASASVDVPGSVVKTTDGGHTWQTLSTPYPAGDICFRSASEGWAGVITPKGPGDLINGLAVLHTTDGGATWRQVLSVAAQDLLSAGGPSFSGNVVAAQLRCTSGAVWFVALGLPAHQETRAYRVYRMDNAGHWALTLASTNAGAAQAAPPLGPLTFEAPDGSTAYVGGTCGACSPAASVLRTTDGGQHWTQMPAPADPSVSFRMSFGSPSEGWLVTHPDNPDHVGLIFHTADGGQTWQQQYP